MERPATGEDAGRPFSTTGSLIAAIPLALLIIFSIEMGQLPTSAFRKAPGEAALVFFWLIVGALVHLWAPLLFQLSAALLQRVEPRRKWGRVGRVVLCLALGGATSWSSYRVLASYPAFAAFEPFAVAFAAFGLFLGAWLAQYGYGWDPFSGRTRLSAAWRFGLPGAVLAAGAAIAVVNNDLYRDSYPSLHLASLQVGYVLVHLGAASLLAALPRAPRAVPVTLWALAASMVVALLLACPLLSGKAGSRAHGRYARHTVLGQSGSLLEVDPFSRAEPEGAAARVVAEDSQGIERFAARSGMPDLGGSFSLRDLNILLVSMEAVRFGETTIADPGARTTPNLAAFAREGAFSFARAYTPAPVTVQVFSSIFSMVPPSMSVFRNGPAAWDGKLTAGAVTVAELLRGEGYSTFWVGHGLRLDGLDQGFGAIKRVRKVLKNPTTDEEIADAAIKALERRLKAGKRFFGWIFFSAPHANYFAHYDDWPDKTGFDRYLQELRYGDEQFGRVLTFLRESGQLDRTIVIFLGDHGEEFKEHGGKYHVNVYEETTHVPFIVRIPGVAGRRIDRPVSTSYVFPWLLGYCAGLPRMTADSVKRRFWGPVLEATDGNPVIERIDRKRPRVAIVDERYRIIHDGNSNTYELYDMVADPEEKNDLYNEDGKLGRKYRDRMRRYLSVREGLKRYFP